MWKYNETDNLIGDSLYHSADELYHYGVLGMKWRYHKAKQNGTNYQYKSFGQRKYEKKVAKLKSKGKMNKLNKAKDKLAMYKERDRARADYAKKTSVGNQLVRSSLGIIGGYKNLRAAGYGRVSSALIGNTLGTPIAKILENKAAKDRLSGKTNTKKKMKKS